jgi:hypothetical protein
MIFTFKEAISKIALPQLSIQVKCLKGNLINLAHRYSDIAVGLNACVPKTTCKNACPRPFAAITI